ncbi:glutamate-cysteine ligase family protein, partial [uncultured Subdoligranulum sp.]
MSKLDEQKKVLVEYFRQGCKPEGRLTFGLEVEHFITHAGGEPATFAEVQSVMQQMQQSYDTPIVIDGAYMGYTTEMYGVSLEPACQLEVSLVPQRNVIQMMDIYNQFYLQLSMTLAARGLRAWTVSYHPTRRAEELPLIPKQRYEAMDRYFKNTGSCGIQMMRATAST